MTFINMHIDNFKAHQNIVVTLSNFLFPFEFTFKIYKAFLYHGCIYHISFYGGQVSHCNLIIVKLIMPYGSHTLIVNISRHKVNYRFFCFVKRLI